MAKDTRSRLDRTETALAISYGKEAGKEARNMLIDLVCVQAHRTGVPLDSRRGRAIVRATIASATAYLREVSREFADVRREA